MVGQTTAVLVAGAAALGCAPAWADGFDWSVGLRGSYAASDVSGVSLEGAVSPEVALTLEGGSGSLKLGAGAEFTIDGAGTVRFSDAHASAEGNYEIDPETSLTGSVDLSLTQAAPGSPTLPTNTAVAPLILNGTAQAGGRHRFGPVTVSAWADGARYVEGDETLYDATVLDHTADSYWRDGAGLRVGLEMSPLLSVFAQGDVSDTHYDAASPTLLVYLNNRLYTLRGGVSYAQDGFSAEASAGRAFLDYGDGSLVDAAAWIADASVQITPSESVTLGAGLETSVGPSKTVTGDTDVGYTLSANASFAVNPWLTLRGSAGADLTQTLGAGTLAFSYSAGTGIDLTTSEHVMWSADYLFTHAATGPENTHTATIGLKIKG
jgi:hypothetical protein